MITFKCNKPLIKKAPTSTFRTSATIAAILPSIDPDGGVVLDHRFGAARTHTQRRNIMLPPLADGAALPEARNEPGGRHPGQADATTTSTN